MYGYGPTYLKAEMVGIKGMVTSVTSSFKKEAKTSIVRTYSKITQIKQEKTQSYTSLQGASNEHRISAQIRNTSAHDAIKDLPSFKT
jgi:hypothetical protein